MPTRLLTTALTTAAFSTIGLGVVLFVLQYHKYDPPYHVKNPEYHRAEVIDRRTLAVYREFDVSRKNIDLLIERSLISFNEHYVTVVQVPDAHMLFAPGQYRMKNIYEVPTLPTGDYSLRNRVCWQANILRKDCLDLPIIDFSVP